MSSASDPVIPVALFAYARPKHLARALESLRANAVPLLFVFSDAARTPDKASAVAEVRSLLRRIDWCDLRLTERPENLGLGRNILSGVTEVLREAPSCLVWEDDLIAVPGTYAWMCAALHAYAKDPRVMSISAWTHPRVTPPGIGDSPYFDARADCWVWGTWTRAWQGMETSDARTKMRAAATRGIPPDAYGADLPEQARLEHRKNTWAVRWLYHHFELGGLCLRPPWALTEHIGFDDTATNAADAREWENPTLRPAPPIPRVWPEAVENPACGELWRIANPPRLLRLRIWRRLRRTWREKLS